ncbi:MAG: large conductance mechanosensitive channel protein MscL [Candidatus Diapherotrites archaeon]|jgi:large conductance mechanosensitive channel|uniref:Large conductance mechanosensitive channel protein MscL n=1 Tax=Candidatus Iainarchaeum sp. TaxID=3101447 RepID=A0A7K4C047_9ARCH|nr:large conductance mechanosensitive channel protein MscL [Candidatus Diapherotrites archaeon]
MAKIDTEVKGFYKEFMDFLNEYKIAGLAIAFIMGVAATSLVKSLVDNIIMPTVTPFIPGGGWKTATIALGPIVWGIGAFAGELLNFMILALVVFLIAKFILKEQKVTKK